MTFSQLVTQSLLKGTKSPPGQVVPLIIALSRAPTLSRGRASPLRSLLPVAIATRSAARRTTRPAARPTRSRPGLQARTHDGALGAATARGRCSPCRLHALGIGRRRISPELTGPAARVRDGAHRISRVELILTGSRWSSPAGRHFFLPFSVGQFSFLPFSVGRWSFLPFRGGQMPGAGA